MPGARPSALDPAAPATGRAIQCRKLGLERKRPARFRKNVLLVGSRYRRADLAQGCPELRTKRKGISVWRPIKESSIFAARTFSAAQAFGSLDPTADLILLTTEFVFESWCSQILSTRQPWRLNWALTLASRVRFLATFASQ